MNLFDKFRVKKWLEVLLAAPDGASSEQQTQARAKLKHIGHAALPQLLQALERAPTGSPLVAFLTSLVDNDSLPCFMRGLASRQPRIRAGVVHILSRSEGYDPHRLLELFANATIPKAVLIQILTAHKAILRPKALLGLLSIVDQDGRTAVFQLVDQVATEAMLPELLPYVRSADWPSRLYVARTLRRFSTASSYEALLHLLTDEHTSVRLAAVEGLAGLQMPVEVGPLCALLRDPDLTIQSKAIEAIIQINHPHTLRHILDFLQDESEYVRRAAVEILNAVGTTEAIKDLLGALGDQDWWVRVRAADALGHIGGSKVVEAVLPLLQDADEHIRRFAVEILNATQDPQSFGGLVQALNDPDWWVQERAVDALAALGDKRAIPVLLPLLAQTTQALPAIIRALGNFGDPQVVEALLTTLPHGAPAVLKEALAVLTVLTEASQADLVQQAVSQLTQRLDGESKALAEGALQTLITKYGQRVRSAPATMSTWAAHSSLLRDSSRDALSAGPPDSTLYGATVLSLSGGEVSTPPASLNAMHLASGAVLDGRYRVNNRIGRGGFGTVVLVEDMVVNEHIILKFLHASLAADEEIIKRFIHELRYARKITHENVIRIYDFLSVGGAYAISMEYFPSHTLADERLPLTVPRALRIMQDICRGMSVAHQAHIVHRDLKPQNILINDTDLVKIVYFGLSAGISATDSRLTQRSGLMGTPTYMAPEQVRGGTIDPRTDVYSLGVIMYELFTGRPPYVGQDPIEIVLQHVEGKPRAPRDLAPDLPPVLEAIILKAMAVLPDDRFDSADTLRESLAALTR